MTEENTPTKDQLEAEALVADADEHGGAPLLVKVATVKAYLKAKGEVRVGGEFMACFNDEVARMLDRAYARCADNNRKTVRPSDL
ncbi:hypothetical protein KJ782_07015 [Patescibacteria group bacterium]|nr:hypothetical protein [Patescibacteria group bacterium]